MSKLKTKATHLASLLKYLFSLAKTYSTSKLLAQTFPKESAHQNVPERFYKTFSVLIAPQP